MLLDACWLLLVAMDLVDLVVSLLGCCVFGFIAQFAHAFGCFCCRLVVVYGVGLRLRVAGGLVSCCLDLCCGGFRFGLVGWGDCWCW